ncbi:MAG: hypothetical protein KA319_07120, partial [Ferruginibacter sp.]|nr:hypothetical protein [Ferruginibacter sp.]
MQVLTILISDNTNSIFSTLLKPTGTIKFAFTIPVFLSILLNTNRKLGSVYGKIRSIAKQDGSLIEYGYDPSGNRISKTVTKNNEATTTYYFRDATGNTMAVYEQVDVAQWTWKEQNLYGSSRLGVWNANITMDGTIPSPYDATAIGSRHYELTNHLGNVLATVSDKKLLAQPNNGCQPGTYPNILNVYTRGTETQYKARIEINFLPNDFASNDGDNFVAFTDPNLPECVPLPPAGSYYIAEVITAQDYYPFGMNMPNRKYTVNSSYRYGFNGKENDKDISEGSLDFGAR